MTMQYIREHYDRRFKRGTRVLVRWHGDLYVGTVVGADEGYLRVQINPLDRRKRPLRFHPNDIEKILPDEPSEEVQP